MYSIDQLRNGITHPKLIAEELNKIWGHRKSGNKFNSNGFGIFEEDWDNLIILDACRYDAFSSQATFNGTLESRTSRASMSEEFIRGNFAGRHLHDIFYVSANHWFAKIKDEIEADIFSFHGTPDDGPNGLTTHPATVTSTALEKTQQYPNKRFIIHYMQPHKPFLGPTGRNIEYEREVDLDRLGVDGKIIRQGYHENLDIVLEEIERLIPHLTGKTVISADHGEMLGEREHPIPVRSFGHPKGVYIEELTKVPWFICEFNGRKNIKSEELIDDVLSENVDERLKNLGYL